MKCRLQYVILSLAYIYVCFAYYDISEKGLSLIQFTRTRLALSRPISQIRRRRITYACTVCTVVWMMKTATRAACRSCRLHASCFHQSSFHLSSSSAVWSAVCGITSATSVDGRPAPVSRLPPPNSPDAQRPVRRFRLTYLLTY